MNKMYTFEKRKRARFPKAVNCFILHSNVVPITVIVEALFVIFLFVAADAERRAHCIIPTALLSLAVLASSGLRTRTRCCLAAHAVLEEARALGQQALDALGAEAGGLAAAGLRRATVLHAVMSARAATVFAAGIAGVEQRVRGFCGQLLVRAAGVPFAQCLEAEVGTNNGRNDDQNHEN